MKSKSLCLKHTGSLEAICDEAQAGFTSSFPGFSAATGVVGSYVSTGEAPKTLTKLPYVVAKFLCSDEVTQAPVRL